MANILICTGIFPPQIGGPAQYAKEVRDELVRQGHQVRVLTYRLERHLPPVLRHELFFWRTLWSLRGVDMVLALDTFSVGWPAVIAARLRRKKIIIRTGGDFLWESYVERTGDRVLLKDFYATRTNRFTFKERCIFEATQWTLQHASSVVFSTAWQRDLWIPVYGLMPEKCRVVENFYGPKRVESHSVSAGGKKIFVGGTRHLVWKNIERLTQAFELARKQCPDIELDLSNAPYEQFVQKIQRSYAVILVSLGDISPNMILDAIRTNTPFVLTRENGLMDRLGDVGVFCDPERVEDIAEKIVWLADPQNYQQVKDRIIRFSYQHSWKDIVNELLKDR